MLLQCTVTPQQYITGTYDLYTWLNWQTKWSKVPCFTKQCDRRGLNPRPPDPELEVLTAQPAHTTCLLPYNTSFHINLRLSHFCRNFPQWMKPYNHSEYMCMPCMLVFIIKNRRPDLKKSILIAFGSLIGHIVNRNGLTSSKAFFCKISKGK